jgi:hypothetical protein
MIKLNWAFCEESMTLGRMMVASLGFAHHNRPQIDLRNTHFKVKVDEPHD